MSIQLLRRHGGEILHSVGPTNFHLMVCVILFAFHKSDLMGKVLTSRVSDRFAYVEQSIVVLLHSVDAYNNKSERLRVLRVFFGLPIHRFLKDCL